MKDSAVVEAVEAVGASVSALAVLAHRGTGGLVSTDADTLRDQADVCLSGLAEVARMEARIAALKLDLVTGNGAAATAAAPPVKTPLDVP